jgi:preprotein translocase subunit SecG
MYIILTVIFSCWVTACVIAVIIIQQRKSTSHLALCESYLQEVLQWG